MGSPGRTLVMLTCAPLIHMKYKINNQSPFFNYYKFAVLTRGIKVEKLTSLSMLDCLCFHGYK